MANDTNVTWHDHRVSREERERLHGHRGCVIWFTGLSGSGKSTIANVVDHMLAARGVKSSVLDGDNVRHGLNAGPGMLRETHGEAYAERFGLGFSAVD
ncbi:MAG: adenylyl-sulfate kinase, partial [Halochromatium sp.]